MTAKSVTYELAGVPFAGAVAGAVQSGPMPGSSVLLGQVAGLALSSLTRYIVFTNTANITRSELTIFHVYTERGCW